MYGASANVTLDCNHEFHAICMDTWKARSNTCPLCRAVLKDNEDFIPVEDFPDESGWNDEFNYNWQMWRRNGDAVHIRYFYNE